MLEQRIMRPRRSFWKTFLFLGDAGVFLLSSSPCFSSLFWDIVYMLIHNWSLRFFTTLFSISTGYVRVSWVRILLIFVSVADMWETSWCCFVSSRTAVSVGCGGQLLRGNHKKYVFTLCSPQSRDEVPTIAELHQKLEKSSVSAPFCVQNKTVLLFACTNLKSSNLNTMRLRKHWVNFSSLVKIKEHHLEVWSHLKVVLRDLAVRQLCLTPFCPRRLFFREASPGRGDYQLL